MEKIRQVDTLYAYDELLGVETLHPLVNVVDFSKCRPMAHFRARYGLYCVFLKEARCGEMIYGRQHYDYQEGTIVCIAPGQVLGFEDDGKPYQPKGWGLVFHPDLIRGTSLGQNIANYHFFSYEVNEALHLSEKERSVILDCMQKIQMELNHDIDTHSNRLIVRNIELLLDYCDRFYDRQFITRGCVNKDVLVRFERILNGYFNSDRPQRDGLPTVAYCAQELHLSANYLGDLIKRETGKTAQEQIQLHLLDVAKERIFNEELSISQIAYELGFRYPQHFTRLFTKKVGCSPTQYRQREA